MPTDPSSLNEDSNWLSGLKESRNTTFPCDGIPVARHVRVLMSFVSPEWLATAMY
jgi:hypothetical protein